MAIRKKRGKRKHREVKKEALTRQALEGIEAEASVFHKHGTINLAINSINNIIHNKNPCMYLLSGYMKDIN